MEKTQTELELEQVIAELKSENEKLNELVKNKSIENTRKSNELDTFKKSYADVKDNNEALEKKVNELAEMFSGGLDEIVDKIVSEKLNVINQGIETERQTLQRLETLNIQNNSKSKQLIDLIGYDKLAKLSDDEIIEAFGIKEIKEIDEKNNEEPQDKINYDEDGFLME